MPKPAEAKSSRLMGRDDLGWPGCTDEQVCFGYGMPRRDGALGWEHCGRRRHWDSREGTERIGRILY